MPEPVVNAAGGSRLECMKEAALHVGSLNRTQFPVCGDVEGEIVIAEAVRWNVESAGASQRLSGWVR
jgi:hypothetical protein